MSRVLIAAILAAVVLGAVAALDWYSHVAAGIALGGPVPLASIAPRPSPQHAAPPVQTSEPSPPAAQPSAAPSAAGTRVRPSAAPKIVAVSLSTPVATGGQIVTGTVTTSADVTRVQASIAGYSSPLTKVSEGYFALSYRVPELPPVLRRTYTITIVAANAKGQSVSSSLPITIR